MKKILQVLLGTAMVAAAVLSCKKDEIKQETLEVSPSKALQFLAKMPLPMRWTPRNG